MQITLLNLSVAYKSTSSLHLMTMHYNSCTGLSMYEKLEDIIGVVRKSKSKDRYYKGQTIFDDKCL